MFFAFSFGGWCQIHISYSDRVSLICLSRLHTYIYTHINLYFAFVFQESSIFEHLRVMVIEDMIYLIHVKGIAELVNSSLNLETELNFVDIEQDPPKVI